MRKTDISYSLLLVLLTATLAFSQTGLGMGEITGYVYDVEGKKVIDTNIVITSPALMGERVLTSGDNGYYRAINLPPGQYTIRVSKPNYQSQEISGISVRAGKVSTLNVTLKVGDFAETVTIIHETPLIDIKSPERRINIDGAFLDRLPLSTTREWTAALSLVPALVTDGEFTGGSLENPFVEVTIHGADSAENMFSMDGASIQTDTAYSPVMFTSAIIDDVEVVTSGYNASLRSGLGGYVNVVTKSGGNDLSGTFQIILQPDAWNWENVEGGHTPKSELYLPEASIGGPILKDRVWFFSSILYDYRNRGIYRDENSLYWLEQNGYSPSDYDYVDERRNVRFFGKVTTALTESDKITATLNWDRTENLIGDDNYLDAARTASKTGGPMFMLNYSRFFGEDLLITLQGSYREGETGVFPKSGDLADIAPSIQRYGEVYRSGSRISYGDSSTLTVDGGAGLATSRVEKHWEFKGDGNLFIENLLGQHDSRFGFYYMPERKFHLTYAFAQPYYSLSQTRDANGDWVTFYAGHFSDNHPGSEYINANAAGYFQDSWTLNDRMTLNYGFRFEKNFAKVDIFRQTAFSPNIGLSYALTGDQKHALRLSYSRKQEVLNNPDLVATYNASIASGASYYYDDDLDGRWDRITDYPIQEVIENTRDNLGSAGTPITLDDNLGPSRADFFQIGYSAVLPLNVTFDAAFLYNIFSDSFTKYRYYNYMWENNEPVALRNPSSTNVYFWTNNEWSSKHYRGLEFSLSRAFHAGWQMMASYAYQLTTEKGEWSPYEPEHYYFQESWFEYSNVNNNPMHVFRLAASYVGPYDIMFNGNIVHRSSLPNVAYRYRSGTGIDVPSTIVLSGRSVPHPFKRMNNWAQPRSNDREGVIGGATVVNLGLGKMFTIYSYRLETQLQLFNIFNDDTFISGAATYVDENLEYTSIAYYSIQAPRAAQLLVKLVF